MTRSLIYTAAVRVAALSLISLLLACSHVPSYSPELGKLDPLQLGGSEISPEEAENLAPTPELLGLTDAMRDFVDRYVSTARSPRQRLLLLHSSLRSSALLGIVYDPEADGSAAQAFERGVANCLTYAHLFVSMARYAGLDARYQVLSLRPQWTRYGTRVALRQHVNVLVRLRRNEHYMVDIDPVQRESVEDTRLLKDQDAFALYHNNLAMSYLRRDQVSEAYAHAVRAVSMSRATDYLWVNLGAIYNRAGQAESAEQSYLTAIALNRNSRSAMNNLVLLYTNNGSPELAVKWEKQVLAHRQRNPYYYIYLGEQAEKAGDFEAAIAHYRAAIKRKDNDAAFYFRLGKLYVALEQPGRGVHYLEKAIERSRLVGEREEYQAFLDRIAGRTLAQVQAG